MLDIEAAIRAYLPEIVHMSLSTSRANKPWTCEVHFAFDENLHLYFSSKPSRRHSQEIADNEFVSGNIVTQHGLGQKVRGVYFEGRAKLLSEVTAENPAYRVYSERFNGGPGMLEEAKKPDGHAFYEIVVDTFYLFDARESSPSQKYQLRWGK